MNSLSMVNDQYNFSYRAENLEMRNELQATTEVPRWFQKWKDQLATTEDAPMWFRRWKEEEETKRKASKKKGIRRAFARLKCILKKDFEAIKRFPRKILSWFLPSVGRPSSLSYSSCWDN